MALILEQMANNRPKRHELDQNGNFFNILFIITVINNDNFELRNFESKN